jgi:hypothetical protein
MWELSRHEPINLVSPKITCLSDKKSPRIKLKNEIDKKKSHNPTPCLT